MYLGNSQVTFGNNHNIFKFIRLVVLTTIITCLFGFVLYLWNKNMGIFIGMILLTQPHFLMAYFFAIGVYKEWFSKKIFWRNFVIWIVTLVLFYLVVYRYLGNGLMLMQRINIAVLFGILLFNLHNAIDMVKFYKSYNTKFKVKKWTPKELIFILAICSLLTAIPVRAFPQSFSKIIPLVRFLPLVGNITILIGLTLFLYLAVKFFLEKKYLAITQTIVVTLIFIAIVFISNTFLYIHIIGLLVLWHIVAWVIFSTEKIYFFQRKNAQQRSIELNPKKGLDAFLFWPKAKVSNFLIFFTVINAVFVILALFIVRAQGLEETFFLHPFYGLYWFILYAGAHVIASLLRDLELLLPRK